MAPPSRRRPGGPPGRAPRRPPGPRHAERRGLGGEQVEGRHAVRELLGAGRRRVREVWLADDLDPAPIIGEIEDLAAARRVALRRVARTRLAAAARTDAPQGVLARADPLPEVDL